MKKRVAVIGGGLIGMRAAVMAAQQGHSVTLYERRQQLGGKAAQYAGLYPFKWPIRRYCSWLEEELEAQGVRVLTGRAPEPARIAEEGYDAIIACTGSTAKRPPIPGAEDPGAYTSEDIYERRVLPEQLGRHIVFVGGSGAVMETAMYLAGTGRAITLITRQSTPARDLSYAHSNFYENVVKIDPEVGYGGMLPAWTAYEDFEVILEARTVRVSPRAVTYVDKDGQEVTLECDGVVVNGGFRPCQSEALAYAGCAPEFYVAGDAEGCSTIQQGNVSAFGKVHLL